MYTTHSNHRQRDIAIEDKQQQQQSFVWPNFSVPYSTPYTRIQQTRLILKSLKINNVSPDVLLLPFCGIILPFSWFCGVSTSANMSHLSTTSDSISSQSHGPFLAAGVEEHPPYYLALPFCFFQLAYCRWIVITNDDKSFNVLKLFVITEKEVKSFGWLLTTVIRFVPNMIRPNLPITPAKIIVVMAYWFRNNQ